MNHIKSFYYKPIPSKSEKIVIEGPVTSSVLKRLKFHPGLNAFREPEEQHQAIIEISELEEGRIIIARKDDTIIGYATILYPDPMERWAEGEMDDLLELGAIEVSLEYRNLSISKSILEVAMMDPYMENYIIITTEYYWHWDLKNSGLDVWQYRDVMEKVMSAGGLEYYATDDPEITSHPANCLMARIGKNVPFSSIEKFDRLRFKNRFMY
ncbi:GNAT family N-acetyltransferase [Alkalibacter mobilis]|uniref:GNAT family N-acetyltransferase n=1 Tax=Alkalibacter mobilis TaxID=2787712 RepID=UPI00189DF0AB|nr:GNAT family N-acetyltransferase [Alkalibacter mobilis]MBF7096485.1 GNAT family N-acetyltransferase [Alkalibacter mobilis]